MDFSGKKPTHIIALILLLGSFSLAIFFPILSYFINPYGSLSYLETIPEYTRLLFEIFTLIIQFVIIILAFVIVPLLWYILVNKQSWKGFLSQIKLRLKDLDMAVLWAVLAVIAGFVVVFIAGIVLSYLNYNVQEVSNIPEMELIFSLPSILVLITIQPVCEEIFYRGFLLDKITSLTSEKIAIVATGILFGIAHIAYANLYPAILTAILGMIFAYAVVKTKNLTTGIIAHIAYNLISIALYIFARSLLFESLIL